MGHAKSIIRANLLWLWAVPAALAWLAIAVLPPAGRATFGMEVAIVSLCSFGCGFGLAWRTFSTFRQRVRGGLYFAGSSLCLLFGVVFLGCGLSEPKIIITPAQMEQQRAQQEIRMKAWVASQLVPRDANADATMLDLSPFYNQRLSFTNSRVRSLSPGTHVWDGIKFDVRGKIQLIWLGTNGLPGIPVHQKCAELYFLHGTGWGMGATTVSHFVVHVAGMPPEIIPMVLGRDVAPEFPHLGTSVAAVPTNAVVWSERILNNAPPRPAREFFISHWRNPWPDRPVETIDFAPGGENHTAFLVAITLKPIPGESP